MAPVLVMTSVIALVQYSYCKLHGFHKACAYLNLCGIMALVIIATIIAFMAMALITIVTLYRWL